MRKKDSILLEDLYSKVQNPVLKESMENMEFEMTIDLDYFASKEIPADELHMYGIKENKVTLKYRIDIEYRSWGIKDITPVGMKLSPFVLTKMNEDFEEVPVKKFESVDLTQAEYEKGSEKSSFSPSSIVLYLDKDLNIVPDKCKVNF